MVQDSPIVSFELRVPTEDEFEAFAIPVFRGFGEPDPSPEELEDEKRSWEPDRSLGALDDGEWIGGTGAYSFDMTLPGGTTAAAAGVTMVGVASTHRRRGVLTALMKRQLDDIVERGEHLAILTASETSIYGRFGYGWSADMAVLELETARSAFRAPPSAPGRLRVVATKDAAAPMAAAYERCRLLRPGTLTRGEQYWSLIASDPVRRRSGASALFVVVHEDAKDEPDGYATYRVREKWEHGLPDNTVVVTDLYGTDPEVEATLWRFVLDIDLAARVVGRGRPVDEPLRWRLLEPRRLLTTAITDFLWTRVLDVPLALAGRRYGASDGLVLEVIDSFRPDCGGCFSLDGGTDGAECTRTSKRPDLTLAADDLGAIYLGGVPTRTLAAAGRITENTSGALRRADALFVTPPAPFNGTMF